MMPAMPGGMPGGMPGRPAEMPHADMPPGKRLKTSEDMVSEEEFTSRHGSSGTFKVLVPKDDSKPEWNLNGQIMDVPMGLMETIKTLKQKISSTLGIPANAQKLKQDVFLKDAWTLAKHNITPGSIIELGVQQRGGQR